MLPCVGAAAVDPVHDVMHLEPRVAPHNGLRHCLSRCNTIRRVRSGTIRWERPTLTGRPSDTKIGLIVPSQVYSLAMASGMAMPLTHVTAADSAGSKNRLMR